MGGASWHPCLSRELKRQGRDKNQYKVLINIFSQYHIFHSVCPVGILFFQSLINLCYLVTSPHGMLKSSYTLEKSGEDVSVCYLGGQSWPKCFGQVELSRVLGIICDLRPILQLRLKAKIGLNCEGGDVCLDPCLLCFLPCLNDWIDLSEHPILTYLLVPYSMLQPYYSFSHPSKLTCPKYHCLNVPLSLYLTGFGSVPLRQQWGFEVWHVWVGTLVLPLISYVTVDKLTSLSLLELSNGNDQPYRKKRVPALVRERV